MNLPNEMNSRKRTYKVSNFKDCCGEYYKKYEHDEIPVRDHSIIDPSTGDNERSVSMTNSHLDQLESKVLKNVSQELQTDGSSYSIDSNIKFFKTTVQQIFETFYSTMQDFEVYKERFNAILEKSKTDSINEMEDFIKEMIQHVISSESVSNESHKTATTADVKDQETYAIETGSSKSYEILQNMHSVVEAYKNDNYLTDSTNEENNSKTKRNVKTGEVFNIYLLSNTPCVEIKMTERNMLSEINIKDPIHNADMKVASADNLKKVEAKMKELEGHEQPKQESHSQDREIPIRVSSAKKNIHLDEDFICEHERNENKSFISKICSFICKKFRKA
ncbi:uncharacterized protein LOC126375735 [Pectinophora gossypiella]|uniref:uncharacterized protein LOC126375735 n=1 Tax=Pectinophora gossypiella TaxID=13191 RepID=UPI00214F04B1|nr:uncharacterized protein LOC126375735 [Pectinophora gossypiella]